MKKSIILPLLLLKLFFTEAQESLEYKEITHSTFYPESITKSPSGNFFITFEKTYFGKLEMTLNSEKEKTIIVHIGEKSINNSQVDIKPPGTVRSLTDTIALKKGEHKYQFHIPDFEPPGWAKGSGNEIPMPEYVGNIIPFRFVEILNYEGEIKKNNIRQIGYYYPFNDNASYCKTSSEELNQIYELCKHSMKATSFAGVYVDGDRERRPYEGDAYINQLSHYAVDAEYALLRKTVDHLFKKPTWPTEWPFHMHMILWEDYMYTGKTDYLEKYYDSLKVIISRIALNDAGLTIDKYKHDIIDWPKNERDGYELLEVNSVPNAFYNNSLQILSKIAGVLNKKDEAKEFALKAQKHKVAFNKYFWDKNTNLFVDAIGSKHSSLHANIFPIVFGLSAKDQNEDITPFIKSKGMAVSVYGAQYLLDALYRIGEDDYALRLLTSKSNRSWIHMIEQGSTITMEAWSEKVKPNLDWNHAWGAAPGNIIARRIFGIRAMEPGFELAMIKPQIGSLKNGEYIQPTINGDIEVRFLHNENLEIIFETEYNKPALLFLSVDKYKNKNFLLNKKETTPLQEENYLIIKLKSGHNTIKCINK